MSQTLFLDMGNSRCKWTVAGTNSAKPIWLAQGVWDNNDYESQHWCAELESINEEIESVVISSVSNDNVKAVVGKFCHDVFDVDASFAQSQTEYLKSDNLKSLINVYQEPLALGIDRWLAMIAAFERCDRGFAVLDAGTAITLDLVDKNSKHLGGHIVPGAGLMKKGLFGDTGKIAWGAQLDPRKATAEQWLGQNSQQAVELGCLQAAQGYLKSCLERLESHFMISDVFVCGGDGLALMEAINKPIGIKIHDCPKLVHEGLYYQSKRFETFKNN